MKFVQKEMGINKFKFSRITPAQFCQMQTFHTPCQNKKIFYSCLNRNYLLSNFQINTKSDLKKSKQICI